MRRICSAQGCGEFVHGNGLCLMHYRQVARSGKIKHKRTAPNEVDVRDGVAYVTLYDRFHEPLAERVTIDAGDIPLIAGRRITHSRSATSRRAEIIVDGQFVRLHRFLLSAPLGVFVDHINGNQFDNRRCNLRLCTQQENNWNRIGAKGVVYLDDCHKWMAQICRDRKRRYLGLFATEADATEARRKAERELFGEFAARRPE